MRSKQAREDLPWIKGNGKEQIHVEEATKFEDEPKSDSKDVSLENESNSEDDFEDEADSEDCYLAESNSETESEHLDDDNEYRLWKRLFRPATAGVKIFSNG